jgi:hypothetical protein
LRNNNDYGLYISKNVNQGRNHALFCFCFHDSEGPDMTGQIIPFQSFRYRKKSPAYQPPESRLDLSDPPRRVRSQSDFSPAIRNRRNLKLQVARIAKLLDELEELARTSNSCPPAIVCQAHAGMERARRILQPCSEFERTARRENDIEDDPQPEFDGEMLERMYRELNPDA